MKNKILLIVGGFLLSLSLFLFPKYSHADDLYLPDQRQLEGTACLTAYSGYNHNQIFTPSFNVLTKVGVKMRNMNGGSVTLTIKDGITTQIIATKTQRMGLDEDWIYFDLVDDALGYIVTPGKYHSIWIGTAYYPEGAPCWIYSGSDVYADGMRMQGITPKDGDFTFTTYGFDLDMGREDPEDPEGETVMVVDEEEEEETAGDDTEDSQEVTQDTETDTSTTEEENDVSNTPDESKDKDDVLVEEDDTVTSPTLESVVKNSEVLDMEDGTVDATEDDIIKIYGTADSGDEVSVIIGEDAYTSTADEDGNWYVVISMSGLEDGDYTVEAQAKDADGKGSKKVEMFILSKSDIDESAKVAVTEEEDTSLLSRLWNGDLWYISLSVALLLLGGLIWLLIFLIKRRKEEEEKKNGVEKKVSEVK